MKRLLFVFLSVLFITPVCFSQTPKRPDSSQLSWRILEKAQVAYDAGNYGTSMQLANTAKENRTAEIDWELFVLNHALNPSAVRKVGDEFDDVITKIKERDETQAVDLIQSYLTRYGKDFFNNSVSKMVSWIAAKKVYPEADFLIGKIYYLEGEYDLAQNYYENARKNAAYLDIPDERFDILYAMSDLAKDKKDNDVYEQTLILILSDDTYYTNTTFMNALVRSISSNKSGAMEKFFQLYRADEVHSIKALYRIGQYYEDNQKNDESLKCTALGAMESFTHMIEVVQERDSEYKYTDFPSFLLKVSSYDDIVEWGKNNNVWENLYLLGKRSGSEGKLVFSRELFEALASSSPDEYWRKEANQQLLKTN